MGYQRRVHGTPQPTMAATQILVALCVVGSAVAAPQISLGRSRSAGTNINENQVVTSVITSLTPSISKAVEEALAAAAAAEQAAAEQAAAEEAAAAAAEAERIKAAQAAQAEAARRQQIAAANAAAAAAAAEKNAFDSQVSADLGPVVNPVYNFEYKVADDEERTYISRNEDEKSPESESKEEEGTTLAPEDGGMHEFDCSEFTDAELAFADPNQIPLECRLRPKEGGEPKTVYILIPKEGLDLTRLFDKNVKVVVKDLMIMDISPK